MDPNRQQKLIKELGMAHALEGLVEDDFADRFEKAIVRTLQTDDALSAAQRLQIAPDEYQTAVLSFRQYYGIGCAPQNLHDIKISKEKGPRCGRKYTDSTIVSSDINRIESVLKYCAREIWLDCI